MGDKMAASPKTENDDLSQLTVDQLRKLLQEKGLPTTGKKKVLIERLVDDSKSNVVKPESKEEMNLAESAESSSEVEIQEINSIRRKALIIIVLSFTNRVSRTSLYLSLKTSFVYSLGSLKAP